MRGKQQSRSLQRQLARWQVPSTLRTAQDIRSDPRQRRLAYARHALFEELAAASRAAQAQVCDHRFKSRLNISFDAWWAICQYAQDMQREVRYKHR